ncbi:MAG: tetratricopeptide repeat protein [Candidatus Thorarchaeota archaeon]|jgi:tetratricopeptide (TPR) repeat protein
MKPIGTITMYFPFIADATKEVLESIMKEAYNFMDFSKLLCDRACSEEVSDELVLIITIFATAIGDFESVERLWDKYRSVSLLKPYFLLVEYYDSRGESEMEELVNAAQSIIDSHPAAWIILEMLSMIQFAGQTGFSNRPEQIRLLEENLDRMQSLFQSDASLECFKSVYYHYLGRFASLRGLENENVLENHQRALENAIAHDNQAAIANQLRWIAAATRNTDAGKSIELLIRSLDIYESFGMGYYASYVLGSLEIACNIRGEFNAALDYANRSLEWAEKHKMGPRYIAGAVMTNTYNKMGNGKDALAWAEHAIQDPRDIVKASAYMRKAWALINLGRIDEAAEWIDKARDLVLRSGVEIRLLEMHHVSGLLEAAQGDTYTAIHSLEQALEIAESSGFQNRINDCLLALTHCELAQFNPNEKNQDDEDSGLWMTRLTEIVEEKDLPGIRGLSLLLKAELRFKQGREEEAHKLLTEVQRLAEHPSMSFLKEKVAELRSLAGQMMDA